jgi:hypothetical protein
MSSCNDGGCGNHDEGVTQPEKPAPVPKGVQLPNGPLIKSRETPQPILKYA